MKKIKKKNYCIIPTNGKEEKDEKPKFQFLSYKRLKDVLMSVLIMLK